MHNSTSKKMSTDALRQFYFSGATNYNAFKAKADSTMNTTGDSKRIETPAASPVARVDETVASPDAPIAAAAGSAAKAVKNNKTAPQSASSVSGISNADAVSPDYIAFLRQQQDLVKAHNAIGEELSRALAVVQQHRSVHSGASGDANEQLRDAEGSTNWNWKSKFSLDTLVHDANLEVPQDELCRAEDLPKVADLQHQHQQLVKLRQDHASTEDKAAFALMLDNGMRRFDRLLKEYSESQLDAAPVTRLSDSLVVQLDHVLSVAPLDKVLQDVDATIAVVSKKQQQCMALREQAMEDGAMDVAERESYRLADLSEELVGAQIERIRLLTSVSDEIKVTGEVRDAYVNKAADDTSYLHTQDTGLKERCERDLANLYTLRREVDKTEQQLVDKWNLDRASSDDKLATISKRQNEAWDQITMLLKQIAQLEAERHAETKHRLEEKVKDESRRNEYNVFCKVADEQAGMLDRTIKNCDINIHCAKLMHEFITTGFNTIQKHISQRKSEVDGVLLSAHQKHLELYRGLLFTLGDLDYKKGKRIDEVSNNIQTAHIQQQLCSDSLNPNAKKFSDAKRDLLRIRDELELELADLRERQSVATEQFEPTETALNAAGVQHQHPTDELEDYRLNMRAKMVEYRAMSLGHTTSDPIKAEVEALRQNMNASRASLNNSRGAATPMRGPQ